MTRRSGVVYALVTIQLVYTAACYRYIPGSETGRRRIEGSEVLGEQRTEISIVAEPSTDRPFLIVDVNRWGDLEFKVELVHQALKAKRRPLMAVGGLFWIGAGTAGILAGKELRSHDETANRDTLTSGGSLLVAGGILAGIGGIYLLSEAFTDDQPKIVPGRTTVGGQLVQHVDTLIGPYAGQTVQIRADMSQREFRSDASGIVRVDVVNDLGLRWFDERRTLQFSITSAGSTIDTALSVDMWTVPCVVTVGAGVVQEAPTATSRRLGEFAPADTFRMHTDAAVDWLAIEYRGNRGWIPRLSAKRCWKAVESQDRYPQVDVRTPMTWLRATGREASPWLPPRGWYAGRSSR